MSSKGGFGGVNGASCAGVTFYTFIRFYELRPVILCSLKVITKNHTTAGCSAMKISKEICVSIPTYSKTSYTLIWMYSI